MTVFEKEFEIDESDESDESDDGCLDVDDDNMVMYFYCALGIL